MRFIPWPRSAKRVFLLNELEHQVASHVTTFPLLGKQLTDTAQFIEKSVVDVCSGFTDIATRASQTVSGARDLLDSDADSGMNSHGERFATVIERSQQMLGDLLQRLVRNSELSMKAVYRIDDVEKAMKEVTRVLNQIDTIAMGTKIVALNAKIEAVRAGEWGAGFEVVADEISRQADQSGAIATSVRDTVTDLRRNLAEAVANLKDLASRDMQDVVVNRQLLETAMSDLGKSHVALKDKINEAAANSEKLASDIFAAVTTLQFQDRVTQRLAHVAEALDAASGEIGRTMHELDSSIVLSDDALERRQAALSKVKERYTMHEERAVHTDAPSTEPAGADGGSVELF